MKVIVRGKNKYSPTESVVDYATKKLARMDSYFRNPDAVTANVLCKEYANYYEVEITIPTKNLTLRAEVKDETINGAIDLSIDKLEGQMRRHKDKVYSALKRRRGVSGHYAAETEFDLKQLQTEVKAINLVREKKIDLTPMSVDDAITQMEMLGHDFFIFQNSETNKVSVVYIRDDKDYGIIETNL